MGCLLGGSAALAFPLAQVALPLRPLPSWAAPAAADVGQSLVCRPYLPDTCWGILLSRDWRWHLGNTERKEREGL
jgi:hypothetical protein